MSIASKRKESLARENESLQITTDTLRDAYREMETHLTDLESEKLGLELQLDSTRIELERIKQKQMREEEKNRALEEQLK